MGRGQASLSCLFVLQDSSMSFFVTLQSNFQHVLQYENPKLQDKARSVIPQQQLLSAAQHKLNELKEADPGEVPSLFSSDPLQTWHRHPAGHSIPESILHKRAANS